MDKKKEMKRGVVLEYHIAKKRDKKRLIQYMGEKENIADIFAFA